MNGARKLFFVFILLAILLSTQTPPASAFDGRSGDNLVIQGDEVVEDDLYATARTFVLDGVVNGDLIVLGQTITINGRVDGDVIAVGQTVRVNGTVTGATRMAGFALLLAEQASVGGDMIAAGYSLETREGSRIGQDILFAGGQILLAGDVARHVHLSARASELRGTVEGSVSAGVGEAGAAGASRLLAPFIPPSQVSIPPLDPGFAVAPSARIGGNLWYRQSRELAFPSGAVAGEVTRIEPAAHQETASERILNWGVNAVRTSISLILLGLFLLWLFPSFMQGWSRKLQSAAWPSLGWGVAAFTVFFLVLLFILIGTILGALLFRGLTLGGLAGTIVGFGILSLFALILGFVLITSFVAKIVFGQALGRWLLDRLSSPLAGHRFWPMVIGVIITVVVIALLRFPTIPAFLGGILNFAVILFGLGALWLWGRERIAS